jgi:DGQHR domain-containing protein
MPSRKLLKVRALRTFQGNGTELFSFFMPGNQLLQIAQISRIHRSNEAHLEGFQRKEIQSHVRRIIEYLETSHVLFPNSIILSVSSEITFKQSRGRPPRGLIRGSDSGILEIPIYDTGSPVAWIVDGQQRSLALSKSKNGDILVPVVAFLTDDIEVQREQFILVNKAKPLSNRLINELLPAVPTVSIPRDIAPRRIPSELCTFLNHDPNSPFHSLIRQISLSDKGIITDTAIINMIRRSIKNPLGALSPYKSFNEGTPDLNQMYRLLVMFWSAVRDAFPEAWGLPPTESRLMHSAGIEAMGMLMDRLFTRSMGTQDPESCIRDALMKIAPYCRWTDGHWEMMNMHWNDVQNTGKHIRLLADTLVQLDYRLHNS